MSNFTQDYYVMQGDYYDDRMRLMDDDELRRQLAQYAPSPPPAVIWLLAVVNTLVALVCAVCDSLAIAVLLRFSSAQVRTSMNVLLANLALSDLLAATLSAPFFIHSYITGEWAWGSAVCASAGFLKKTSLYVSTNSLACISIHRAWLATSIKTPQSSIDSRTRNGSHAEIGQATPRSGQRISCPRPRHTMLLLLSCIWLLSGLLVLPTLLYSRAQPQHIRSLLYNSPFTYTQPLDIHQPPGSVKNASTSSWSPGDGSYMCMELWPVDGVVTTTTYSSLLIIAEYVVPVVIIVTCHYVICSRLFSRDPASTGCWRWSGTRRRGSKVRAFYLLTAIILAFLICWTPYYGYEAYRNWWKGHFAENKHRLTIWYVVESVAAANSMCNALLNILANKNIRQHVRIMVTRSSAYKKCQTKITERRFRLQDERNGAARNAEGAVAGGRVRRASEFCHMTEIGRRLQQPLLNRNRESRRNSVI